MIVAVIRVDAVDVAVDDVIDVSVVRYGFVAAPDAVIVFRFVRRTGVIGRARGTARVRGEFVLVDVVAVYVVQVPVVNVVDVIVVNDRDVTAILAVKMVVAIVDVVLDRVHALPRALGRLRDSVAHAAQLPYSVTSWWVDSKPCGRARSTEAHPSSSYTRPHVVHEK